MPRTTWLVYALVAVVNPHNFNSAYIRVLIVTSSAEAKLTSPSSLSLNNRSAQSSIAPMEYFTCPNIGLCFPHSWPLSSFPIYHTRSLISSSTSSFTPIPLLSRHFLSSRPTNPYNGKNSSGSCMLFDLN